MLYDLQDGVSRTWICLFLTSALGSATSITQLWLRASSLQWDLVGGCKYDVNGVVKSISWMTMMAAANPHEILKQIEVGTGLGIPKSTPATTPRALAYRVIASALATAPGLFLPALLDHPARFGANRNRRRSWRHLHDMGSTPLMPLYEKNDHRLALTTARVLGGI